MGHIPQVKLFAEATAHQQILGLGDAGDMIEAAVGHGKAGMVARSSSSLLSGSSHDGADAAVAKAKHAGDHLAFFGLDKPCAIP